MKSKTKLLLSLAPLALAPSLHAVDYIWDGGGANAAWGQAGNWVGDLNPASLNNTSDVIYADTAAARLTETNFLGANRTIRSLAYDSDVTATHTLQFSSAGGTFPGRDIVFDADSGNSTVTVDSNALIIWQDSGVVDAGGSGAAILNNDLDIVHNGTGIFRTLNAIIDGTSAAKVTKSGTGSLELKGTNTFSGGLEIQNGQVFISTSNSGVAGLGTGDITLNSSIPTASSPSVDGATLFVQDPGAANPTITNDLVLTGNGGTILIGGNTTTFSGATSGTGDLRKNGGGNVIFSGAYSFGGDLTVDGGGAVTLGQSGTFTFDIDGSGVNNTITQGIGTTSGLSLDGTFVFDLTSAGTGLTDEWSIIGSTILAQAAFGTNFDVSGFTEGTSGVWTSGIYQFDEGTGNLTVVPEPSAYALLGGLLALSWVMVRRRK